MGLPRDKAISTLIQSIECRVYIRPHASNRGVDDIQAIGELLHRLEPSMASDVDKSERLQVVNASAAALSSELEKYIDDRECALDQ